ncbi:MAG TPA: hypothetical protein PKA12_16155 [Saprospiraceae bacterium]|nr:hypothetical protein [Saprospiraceae bacterium]
MDEYVKINFKSYESLYHELHYKIDEMVGRHVHSIRGQIGNEYRIDSFIAFNSERNKLFTTLNTKNMNINSYSDLVQNLYGVKIDNKWLLFFSYNLIAQREGYKKDVSKVFTWDELSYVAREQMFPQFIGFDENSNIIISDNAFIKHVKADVIGGSRVSPEGSEDEKFLRLWNYKQSVLLDSLEFKELAEKDSVKIDNPLYQIDKPENQSYLFNTLIFDSKEWKEYLHKKYGRIKE